MKLIIDMPEEEYKDVVDNVFFFVGHLVDAIKNGTPIPDNATNGDVIRAVFGICLDDFKKTWGGGSYTDDIWNAPYQKGGK